MRFLNFSAIFFALVGAAGESLVMDSNNGPVLVQEWDSERFHRRVLDLQAIGYTVRLETYCITPEVEPDTGKVIHHYSIELFKLADPGTA
jgi:hypothetical protein